MREIGFTANRRLLRVQSLSHDPITGINALHTITDPVTTPTGTRIPGLRLGQQRSHALLTALPMFRLQPNGFRNRDLRVFTAQLRGIPPETVTVGQMTYDLRRLRIHGLIEKIPHSNRYQTTETGLTTAKFINAIHDRLQPTGLAHLADHHTTQALRAADRAYQHAINELTQQTGRLTRPDHQKHDSKITASPIQPSRASKTEHKSGVNAPLHQLGHHPHSQRFMPRLINRGLQF